jgi:hypothetical protein
MAFTARMVKEETDFIDFLGRSTRMSATKAIDPIDTNVLRLDC